MITINQPNRTELCWATFYYVDGIKLLIHIFIPYYLEQCLNSEESNRNQFTANPSQSLGRANNKGVRARGLWVWDSFSIISHWSGMQQRKWEIAWPEKRCCLSAFTNLTQFTCHALYFPSSCPAECRNCWLLV